MADNNPSGQLTVKLKQFLINYSYCFIKIIRVIDALGL